MIRLAEKKDLDEIDAIYNQAIDEGFLTAHTESMTPAERVNWFRDHPADSYPVYVFEEEDQIRGWATLSPYRKGRKALAETSEISFYVDFDSHGNGIGSKLVDHCIQHAPSLGKRVLFAIIIEGNRGSVALLKKFGFEPWGFLPKVLHYRDEIRGQIYMGKVL